MKVVLASNNLHKYEEISAILSRYGYEVIMQRDIGFRHEVSETGASFRENSYLKAKAVFDFTGLPTIADDSGLSVDVLDGAPGIYSARFGGTQCKSDAERTQYLLDKLKCIPSDCRKAEFICCITLLRPDRDPVVAEGTCPGYISFSPAGTSGFGYDPVFYVPEAGCTFAEMDESLKNSISHRARALKKFCEILDGEKNDDQ